MLNRAFASIIIKTIKSNHKSGCNTFFKGTIIPDNCVVAAHSVVCGVFDEESTLIAGNPAKVIKRNVTWKV